MKEAGAGHRSGLRKIHAHPVEQASKVHLELASLPVDTGINFELAFYDSYARVPSRTQTRMAMLFVNV